MSIALHLLIVGLLLLPLNSIKEIASDDTSLEQLPPIEEMLIDLELIQSEPFTTSDVRINTPSASPPTSPSVAYTQSDTFEQPQSASQYADLPSTYTPSDSLYILTSHTTEALPGQLGSINTTQTQTATSLYNEKELKTTLNNAINSLKESTIIAQQTQPTTDEERERRNERYDFYRANYRTIYNFLKVYPYAIMVSNITAQVDAELKQLTSAKERRALIKKTEKELFEQFEGIVKKMSYSQGKILLKLIARETGTSTYEIIKNYKGTFSASFWYSIGRLFTANIKTEYDKEGEDRVIEEVLKRSEKGEYLLIERGVYLY